MNFVRKALSAVGSICLAALLIAALTPTAAHGLVAAFVQVTNTALNPVIALGADKLPSTEVTYFFNTNGRFSVTVSGLQQSCLPPANNAVFVLTDYSWHVYGCTSSNSLCQFTLETRNFSSQYDSTSGLTDANGDAAANVHLTTGVVVPWSENTLNLSYSFYPIQGAHSQAQAFMYIHGYFAPNE